MELFESDSWKGGSLLVMSNPVARPSAEEVAVNHPWLRPMILASPAKVGCESLGMLFQHQIQRGILKA